MSAHHTPMPHLDDERPTMTAQTAHSPARINPDTRAVLVVVLLGILLLLVAAGALSFSALSAVGGWAGVVDGLVWFVPVFIEGAIIVYTGVAIVHTARHELALARRAWWWVRLWTAVSAAANGAHAWDAGPGGWQGMVGVILAALIPVAVYGAVHMATGLIVATVEPVTLPTARTADTGQAASAGRTDSGRTTPAPDPLVVLKEIETAPRTDATPDTGPDASAGQVDGQRTDGRADSGRTDADAGHLAGRTDTGQATSAVRVEQPALKLVPDAARTDGYVYDQSADTAADTRTDSAPHTGAGQTDGHDDGQRTGADTGRTASARERRASASVEAVRPQIEELARQGMSGREIAGHLGIGRTRACEIVRDLREAGALVA